jgi:hypothetical protein
MIDLHVERMLVAFRSHGVRVPLKRVGPRRYSLPGTGLIELSMVDGRVKGAALCATADVTHACLRLLHCCRADPAPTPMFHRFVGGGGGGRAGTLADGGEVDLLEFLTSTVQTHA